MKKVLLGLMLVTMLGTTAACGSSNHNGGAASPAPASSPSPDSSASPAPSADPAAAAVKTVSYLGKDYTVPQTAQRIVITGAVEAMEDSVLLDIHPVGAISFSGAFPALFQSITDKAEPVGEKTEPNFEKILALKPDVILASSKFDPAVTEKLSQIAVTLPYSHVSTDWEANLTLLGELTGKQEQAAKEISQYKEELEQAKTALGEKLKDQKVAVIRVRSGQIAIFGPTLFFNPIVYSDLGLTPPPAIAAAKKQEMLSIEKFAEINPDLLFIQFSEDENKQAATALDDLQKNPIFKSINAVKNGKVFINVVDPLAQGGTGYSKIQFLKAFVEKAGA
ncbi:MULTISPECIES: ABC transporter substrate-binding protein [unclassified Paenibacillus]|uniref:ABC transporter substrate-binding protein n=1 Tax=unclassified Paenibacillus TaxID=185978 RepID=UPI000954FA4E|nr:MULTISPECIES: ABC transporter substrate-binding protein [unclassified Paenibacillus]ASS67814.1 ABC transporter substrate-binding protein [Paenibacillus sp. RUD330]SIR60171.1 iron complex transport system substrate-binding protein [Paenibacillus sp. RU4X]SIR69029.1 iron complex transport system substrate-binding protein [Paenibacillus sp. RU4T]